jgi:hypothetical protein
MTEDYTCQSCGVAMFVPGGEDPLEAEVRYCGACAIEEIERLREEKELLHEALILAHKRADYWTEQAANAVAAAGGGQ